MIQSIKAKSKDDPVNESKIEKWFGQWRQNRRIKEICLIVITYHSENVQSVHHYFPSTKSFCLKFCRTHLNICSIIAWQALLALSIIFNLVVGISWYTTSFTYPYSKQEDAVIQDPVILKVIDSPKAIQ